MNSELWKPIAKTGGKYSVSNTGKVRNNETGKEHVPQESHHGYFRVNLMIGGKQKNFYVHRLVAEAFVSNPCNFPQINHKDENKKNNFSENLEWCTAKYNCNYGTKNHRTAQKLSVKVNQYSIDGAFIQQYPSISEAARKVCRNEKNIRAACNGNRHTCGGYRWEKV